MNPRRPDTAGLTESPSGATTARGQRACVGGGVAATTGGGAPSPSWRSWKQRRRCLRSHWCPPAVARAGYEGRRRPHPRRAPGPAPASAPNHDLIVRRMDRRHNASNRRRISASCEDSFNHIAQGGTAAEPSGIIVPARCRGPPASGPPVSGPPLLDCSATTGGALSRCVSNLNCVTRTGVP
jgi:hypothetical protein